MRIASLPISHRPPTRAPTMVARWPKTGIGRSRSEDRRRYSRGSGPAWCGMPATRPNLLPAGGAAHPRSARRTGTSNWEGISGRGRAPLAGTRRCATGGADPPCARGRQQDGGLRSTRVQLADEGCGVRCGSHWSRWPFATRTRLPVRSTSGGAENDTIAPSSTAAVSVSGWSISRAEAMMAPFEKPTSVQLPASYSFAAAIRNSASSPTRSRRSSSSNTPSASCRKNRGMPSSSTVPRTDSTGAAGASRSASGSRSCSFLPVPCSSSGTRAAAGRQTSGRCSVAPVMPQPVLARAVRPGVGVVDVPGAGRGGARAAG